MHRTVYLAGHIGGLNFEMANNWRQWVTLELAKCGITALTPMRGKASILAGQSEINRVEGDPHPLTTPKGIVTRDRFDVARCDAVLVNLLGLDTVSIGTMIEFGWADAFRKPLVCVMEPASNVHDHVMVRELIGFRVPTLEAGIAVVKSLLCEWS